ncbi:unnamed protein product [Prunus armeniaca]|uniref:Uncharacterized protein n=1 Tax=Prunus armeniaca TaxID=36596 RepID=A0A6J5VGY7_PRUAR|nr:unnamed protein product [Prunus armeniaca]
MGQHWRTIRKLTRMTPYCYYIISSRGLHYGKRNEEKAVAGHVKLLALLKELIDLTTRGRRRWLLGIA